jgi:hypothetical protein
MFAQIWLAIASLNDQSGSVFNPLNAVRAATVSEQFSKPHSRATANNDSLTPKVVRGGDRNRKV